MSVFRSAIVDADGSVDAGYLSMFWALIGWSVNNVIILIIAACVVKLVPDASALVQNTGIALGANATGFAAVLGAVGLFRMGDKPRVGVITASASQSSSTPIVPEVPAVVAPAVPARKGKA